MTETIDALLAWFRQLSGTEAALAGAGVAAFLPVIVARMRKPMLPEFAKLQAEPAQARGVCAWLVRQWQRLLTAIDYLSTRRKWRYAQPWVLMLGEQGAGKSSLLHSVAASMRQTPPARAGELKTEHVEWLFVRQGALLDADGRYAAAAENSPEAAHWRETLAAIDALRPERPLDGVVLCISARTLLYGGSVERETLAQRLNKQLSQLQQRIEFSLPLTVVVTQCDCIKGFAAYWNNQERKRRSELFGYAAPPKTQSTSPGEWTHTAFETLDERLRALQVEAAAARDSLVNGDAFFLFPGRFGALGTPLALMMETLLRSSAWQAGYLLRGIFFSGSPNADGEVHEGPRKDVAFADSLLGMRVLAEPGLARPTRNGVFSRSGLIRTLQYGTIYLCIGLFVALYLGSLRVERQVKALTVAIQQLDHSTPDAVRHGDCLSAESVYPLLGSIAAIDNDMRYWAIPASWLDTRIANRNNSGIERGAINAVLMPTLACRLENRARDLAATSAKLPDASADDAYATLKDALNGKLADVRAFEDNLARFKALAQRGGEMRRRELLHTLAELSRYAFDAPLPPAVMRERGALSAGFGSVPADLKPELPDRLRQTLAEEIVRTAHAARRGLNLEVARGAELLGRLDRAEAPVLENTRRFADWLEWAQKSWLLSTVDTNPCAEAHAAAKAQIDVLVGEYGFPQSLWREVEQFSTERCYQPELQNLVGLRQAPYGALFVPRQPGGYEMSADLRRELGALPTLVSLNFMRIERPRRFTCLPAAEGFRQAEVSEAAGYVAEYERFIAQLKLPPLSEGRRPLYDRLARLSLANALDDAMQRAQIAPTGNPIDQVDLETVTRADQQLAAMSKQLGGGLDTLLGVLRNYGDYGNAASAPLVRQCARDFAADSLGRVSALAASSRLYYPPPAAAGDDLFDLGSLPVQKEFLARQVARSQVLAAYATPFMGLLQGSQGVSDTRRASPSTAEFWRNTIDELNRYTQGKEPTGQVANLDNYFIRQLGDMRYANCTQQLAKYQSPDLGNDLFSARRRNLEPMVQLRCMDRRVAQAMESYTELASRFNSELAGRYPFAGLDAADARVGVVRQFFLDYDRQRPAIGEALAVLNGDGARSARQFVAELDAAANFFRPTLSAADGGAPIRLQLNFNAQPQVGAGGEQIVAWTLGSGNRVAGQPNRGTMLDWQAGEALTLDLTWADRSLWAPQADPAQQELRVVGRTASFAVDSPWALLRLIERHAVKGNATPSQLMLGFNVPQQRLAPTGKAERSIANLYLGVSLGGTDPKSKAEISLGQPPGFPRHAPDIE